jgi:hypothetical protein
MQSADAMWLYGYWNLAAYWPPYKPTAAIDSPPAAGPLARRSAFTVISLADHIDQRVYKATTTWRDLLEERDQ